MPHYDQAVNLIYGQSERGARSGELPTRMPPMPIQSGHRAKTQRGRVAISDGTWMMDLVALLTLAVKVNMDCPLGADPLA